MVWSTMPKTLGTTSTTAHRHMDPNVVGSTPKAKPLAITPSELFGAAARSSHLNHINIGVASPESEVMARLIEQYVDNTSSDFALLSNVKNLKDYVRSYFTGTVAAGLAYMVMINEGYVWSDHFENIGGGNTKKKPKPDYAFAGPATGLALMEAKGSRSGSLGRFDSTVLDGYSRQVEPHLGHSVGSQLAVRGYSIGAWMKSSTCAELRVHHTAPPVQAQPTTQSAPAASGAAVSAIVQRNNFATAFGLVHSPLLSQAIRHDDLYIGETEAVILLRFRWLGQYWLTSPRLPLRRWDDITVVPHILRNLGYWPWQDPFIRPQMFAIREDIATAVLRSYLDGNVETDRIHTQFEVVGDDLRSLARAEDLEGAGGAIFPDGLALVGYRADIDEQNLVVWRRGESDLESW